MGENLLSQEYTVLDSALLAALPASFYSTLVTDKIG
jgi:hypothetical protein